MLAGMMTDRDRTSESGMRRKPRRQIAFAETTSNCGMNGRRCAGDREFLTVRLRQSCDLAGSFGVNTVFPK
jgi:hypothetical protein